MNRHEYARALRNNLQHVGEFPAGYARLGRGDGSGVIIADISRRLVYVFEAAWQVPSAVPVAQAIDIRSLNNPALEGMRVRLGYPPYAPDRVHVLGFDAGEGMAAVGGLTPQEQLTAALAVPQVANIADFRITAIGGLVVRVNPGKYYQFSTGDWQYFGGDDITLSMPATSGHHQMQVVCLDTETGELAVISNTSEAGTIKAAFDLTTIDGMTVPDGYLLCGAVHCVEGATELSEADIYRDADPRVVFTVGGAGGSTGGDTVRVSANDTTPSYLGEKLVAGTGITLTEQDDGANETLLVSATPPTFGKLLQTRTVLYDNTRSGAGNWDVSSISQDYDDLEIIIEGATNTASVNNDSVIMWFNNDTTATNYYSTRYLNSQGADSIIVQRQDNAIIGFVPGNNRSSDAQWGIIIAHVPGYTRTSVRKHVISHCNERFDTSRGQFRVTNGTEWESTAAINRVAVACAGQFVAGSRLRIIGIRQEVIGTAISEYSTANVSNPPTDAELDALFGTPATLGARWSAIINDAGAGSDEYLVWSDGTNWWYVAGTKAT